LLRLEQISKRFAPFGAKTSQSCHSVMR
jgi:hypothetical protein